MSEGDREFIPDLRECIADRTAHQIIMPFGDECSQRIEIIFHGNGKCALKRGVSPYRTAFLTFQIRYDVAGCAVRVRKTSESAQIPIQPAESSQKAPARSARTFIA